MGANSKIEWTDHTFNPWRGCQKISPGCKNCYAERDVQRWGKDFSQRERTSADNWKKPLAWNRAAEKQGVRQKVFCASEADVFDAAVPPEWRRDLWDLILATPSLDWQLLTKRPENFAEMWPWHPMTKLKGERCPPPANVWLGVSVETQEYANRRIPLLLATAAAVRFLSCEPLLGPVDLCQVGPLRWDVLHGWKPAQEGWPEGANTSRIDWVIVGGESGPGARPMHPDWARSLRDQCQAAGVAFFFKQWGEWLPADQSNGFHFSVKGVKLDEDKLAGRVGKKAAGRTLDGRQWSEFPEMAKGGVK